MSVCFWHKTGLLKPNLLNTTRQTEEECTTQHVTCQGIIGTDQLSGM